jgi:predicted naringenin-chalcone synthase
MPFNMSSATVLFALKGFLEESGRGAKGCAMGFGPGLTAETMPFRTAREPLIRGLN